MSGNLCLLTTLQPVITVLFNDIVSSFTVVQFSFQVITFDFYSSYFQVCLYLRDTSC